MLVKCKICGNKIDKATAYCVPKTGKNKIINYYYCSEDEYKNDVYQKSVNEQLKTKLWELIVSFIGETQNTILYKEMTLWGNDKQKIIGYLTDNKDYISRVMAKDFVSEYAKIRYFSAIIKNNINDYKPKPPEVIKQSDNEFYESKYVPRKRRKCLLDYKDGENE